MLERARLRRFVVGLAAVRRGRRVRPARGAEADPVADRRALLPDPPLDATLDGWYLDPLGRFLLRYWDGTRWTGFVSNGRGDESLDLPWPVLTSRRRGALTE